MRKIDPAVIAGIVLMITAMACAGTAAPTQSPDSIGTIVAATLAARTPEPTATTSAPTAGLPTLSLPTTEPTSILVLPTIQPSIPTIAIPGTSRIRFLADATTGVVTGTVPGGQAQSYVLGAAQGQILMVNVDSTNHDVTLSIKTAGGTSMLNASAGLATWQQPLPQTEDYFITIHGGATTESFTLTVTIPSRIKFSEGASSAKISGKTAGGFNVLYTAFAIKGQKMSVELGNLSGEAALTIYGYTDGTPYVRYVSEQTSFAFTLPSTQDYIIEVVPKAGSVVSYLLVVKIQ